MESTKALSTSILRGSCRISPTDRNARSRRSMWRACWPRPTAQCRLRPQLGFAKIRSREAVKAW